MARQAPELSFTSLNHHLDLDWLREAYRRTRKDGAVGVDGQTAAEYAEHLEENLQDLLDRAKSGRYRAPAVKRAHIPKGDGVTTRPIGIPTFEDKILQRAVAMVLEPIYEQDFRDCSYGFRPGRSAHQALGALRDQLRVHGGGWVIEVDIQGFFDTLDRAQLRAAGTPQGGVISPLLANIYLHEVLDVWFEQEARPRLKGWGCLVRYADDAVLGFAYEEDARRVMDVLPKRFGKYGLTLHPEKTRRLDFRKPTPPDPKGNGRGSWPGAFDFLGFTHHWGTSRKGNWVIRQKTAKDRFSRAVKRIGAWCREHRHWSIREQHGALVQKLRGHYGYYGLTGNSRMLGRFRDEVTRRWRYWLNRRSQQRKWTWERFARCLRYWPLPPATPVHSIYRQAANP